MARRTLLAGDTSIIVPVFVQDATSTTGAGLGSLVYNSSGLTCKYKRRGDASYTTVTLVTATVGTYVSGGFKEDTSGPAGSYELHLPNAAVASGAKWVVVELYGATNMVPVKLEVELVAYNPQDATRLGLAALPNAAANAAGGLYTLGGTGVGVASIGNGVITAASIAAAALNGKGDWLLSSGYTAPDNATITAIAGYVDTEVAAIKLVTDHLATALETAGGGVYRFTTAAMANAPAGGGGSGGAAGSGADPCTLNFKVGGVNLADADVWVSSDAAGTVVVAGTLQTDSAGDVTFLLDAGVTYYVWMQKDGVNPIRGSAYVAVAD